MGRGKKYTISGRGGDIYITLFIAQKYLNPKYTSAEWTTGSVGVFNGRAH